jgi:predicted Zn-dependent protease
MLKQNFLNRLRPRDDEVTLVAGWRALAAGDEEAANAAFRESSKIPDGAVAAGYLALRRGRASDAARYLEFALKHETALGTVARKYGAEMRLTLPITEELSASLGIDAEGVLLALTESYQQEGRVDSARSCLERLRSLRPDDVLVQLSLAELLLEEAPTDPGRCSTVIGLSETAEQSANAAALLLYRSRALRVLRRFGDAQAALLRAREMSGLPAELSAALRLEQILLWRNTGATDKANGELAALQRDSPEMAALADAP